MWDTSPVPVADRRGQRAGHQESGGCPGDARDSRRGGTVQVVDLSLLLWSGLRAPFTAARPTEPPGSAQPVYFSTILPSFGSAFSMFSAPFGRTCS